MPPPGHFNNLKQIGNYLEGILHDSETWTDEEVEEIRLAIEAEPEGMVRKIMFAAFDYILMYRAEGIY